MSPHSQPILFKDGTVSHKTSSFRTPKVALSVVLPAYNEASCIGKNLHELVRTLRHAYSEFEVIVVDDGSTDGTAGEARFATAAIPEVRVIRYDRNAGKGAALAKGALFASGEYVVFLDADLDLHPGQIQLFVESMQVANADAVVGSKHHPMSEVFNYPAVRRLYSFGYYAFVRAMFGLPLRDTQTGLKIFRKQLLHDVVPRLVAKRFAFDLELLANAYRLGYAMIDAPVRVEFQRSGRINWRDAVKTMVDTLAIFYRMHVLRYYNERRPVPPLDCYEVSVSEEIGLLNEALAV